MKIFPFYIFTGTKTLLLCRRVPFRYKEATFVTKLLIVLRHGVRYKEVSAMSVRYK